jgi:hypothetical protein
MTTKFMNIMPLLTGTCEAVTVPKYFGSARDKQGTYVTRKPRGINTLHSDKLTLTDTYSRNTHNA